MHKIQSKIVILYLSFLIAVCAVSAEENIFGTKVLPGDSDIVRLIKNLPDNAAIGFWDIGPNPDVYDVEDIVYLDLPPIGITNTNDIRLTAFGDHPAGSKVTPFDNDIGKSLTLMNYPYIGFLNLKGSEYYDLEDPVYLHQNSIINLAKAKSDLSQTQQDCEGFIDKESYTEGCKCRVPRGASVITYSDGYKAIVSDEIANPNPNRIGNCGKNGLEAIQGIKGYYYHILGTEKLKIVSMKDASLLKRTDLLGESIVANTEDINNLTGAVNYISKASQQTITNDIRLNSIGGSIAGTKVVDFNRDHNKLISPLILVTFPPEESNLGALRFYDQNGNGLYDGSDDIYMDISFPGSSSAGQVAINDIRLTNDTFDQRC